MTTGTKTYELNQNSWQLIGVAPIEVIERGAGRVVLAVGDEPPDLTDGFVLGRRSFTVQAPGQPVFGRSFGPEGARALIVPLAPRAVPTAYQLLAAASGTAVAVTVERGGQFIWSVAGAFDGATAAIEFLGPDGTTWMAPLADAGAALTATVATVAELVLGAGDAVRVKISGAGSNTSLSASLRAIG